MRKILCILLLTAIALSGCQRSDSGSGQAREENRGTITLWCHFADQQEKIDREFNKKYPDITVKVVTVPWADYEDRFNVMLASGGNDVPDIVTAEANWWGKWLNKKGVFEDLGKLGIHKDDISPAASGIIINTEGKFIVVPISFGIGCIWYRKDMTMKYLGTDSADTLQKMLPTWDSYLSLGEKIRRQSGGKEFLFPDSCSLEEYFVAAGKPKSGNYTKSGKFALSELCMPYFSIIEKMLRQNYIAKYIGNDLEQSYVTGNVMFYPYADWQGGIIKDYDKYGVGKWGVMFGPEGPFFRGGEGYLIMERSDESRKKLAAKLINFVLSPEGSGVVIGTNQYSAYKNAFTEEVLNQKDEYYDACINWFFHNGFQKITDKLTFSGNDSFVEKELRLQSYHMMVDGISAKQALENAAADISAK